MYLSLKWQKHPFISTETILLILFSVGALCSDGCTGFCFSWCLMQRWMYWLLFQLVPYTVMNVLVIFSLGALCSNRPRCIGFYFSWCLMQ